MHRHCSCNDKFEGDKENLCRIRCNNDSPCKGYSYSIAENACQVYTTSECQANCQVVNNEFVGDIKQSKGDFQSGCYVKKIGMTDILSIYEN